MRSFCVEEFQTSRYHLVEFSAAIHYNRKKSANLQAFAEMPAHLICFRANERLAGQERYRQ